MALTTLDPDTALIVVNPQKGIGSSPFVDPIGEVVNRACAPIGSFRERLPPVVHVNAAGRALTEQGPRHNGAIPEGSTDLIPELDQQTSDILVTKPTWGAFASTDLIQGLKSLGVTQVVVTGVATGSGVEATARQASAQGFNVTLAIDFVSEARAEAHDYSTRNVLPRLGETGTIRDSIELLGTGEA
jgi:nicotinamidase-related amidase